VCELRERAVGVGFGVVWFGLSDWIVGYDCRIGLSDWIVGYDCRI
jgi:hypothetical protein